MSYEPPAGILVGSDADSGAKKGDSIEFILPETLVEISELGKGRQGPGLVPVGIVRTKDPANHYTFQAFERAWIAPELGRRVKNGVLLDSPAPIRQALIVFPPRTEANRHKVLLNDEVQFIAAVRPSYPSAFSGRLPGEEMTLSLRDMFDLRELSFEDVDMARDGFAWMRPEGDGWTIYFNFLPNSGYADAGTEDTLGQVMRAVQDAVAQEVLRQFLQGVFADDEGVRTTMAVDGWCPTPVLLPGPWQSMCAAYNSGDVVAAEALALAAVGPAQLDMMLSSWTRQEPFASDRRFLETGVERYKAGDYISAVSVILPRIEGLANRVRESRGIGARDSISQVFQSLDQLASAEVRDGYVATRIREEFDALLANFLLAYFRPSAPDAGATRGRHAHAHGATGDPQYDQVYALKIILALDALHLITR